MNIAAYLQLERVMHLIQAVDHELDGNPLKAVDLLAPLFPNAELRIMPAILGQGLTGHRVIIAGAPLGQIASDELATLKAKSEVLYQRIKEATLGVDESVLAASYRSVSTSGRTDLPETANPHQRSPNAQQSHLSIINHQGQEIPSSVAEQMQNLARLHDLMAHVEKAEIKLAKNYTKSFTKPKETPAPQPQPAVPQVTIDPDKAVIHAASHVQGNTCGPILDVEAFLGTPATDSKPTPTPQNTQSTEGPVYPVPARALLLALASCLAEISETAGGYKHEQATEILYKALRPDLETSLLQLEDVFQEMGKMICATVMLNPNLKLTSMFQGPLYRLAQEVENTVEVPGNAITNNGEMILMSEEQLREWVGEDHRIEVDVSPEERPTLQ